MTKIYCVERYVADAMPKKYWWGFVFKVYTPDDSPISHTETGRFTVYDSDPNAYIEGQYYELEIGKTS